MSVYILPHYFKKYHPENMVDISTVASVLHNQSADQEHVAVCITRSMFAMVLNGKKIIHTLPLTLDEFSKQTGRSLTRFKQDFKTIFTLPPKQWINLRRLEHAHTLLVNTNRSVSEICYECGFENLSHFIQLFNKHYGITPKKLQQREFG